MLNKVSIGFELLRGCP